MSARSREFSKFLSGIAFHETVGHWWLGIWGTSLLPWKTTWFTFTADMNTVAMIAWPIVFMVLVWYGWGHERTAELPGSRRPGPVT